MFEERTIHIISDGSIWNGTDNPPANVNTTLAICEIVNDSVVNYWLRLSAAKAFLSERVRQETREHIISHISQTDQLNMNSSSSAMLQQAVANPEDSTPPEIVVAANALRTSLDWIKLSRIKNRTIRTNLSNSKSVSDLNAIDMTLPSAPEDAIAIAKAITLA